MLRRALGRSLALLLRSPAALVLPNLQASLACGTLVLFYAAAVAAKFGPWAFVLLKTISALAVWMLFSWLAFSSRKGFEDPGQRLGIAGMKAWLRRRGKERILAGLAVFAGTFWSGLALNFYRAAALGGPLETAVLCTGILGALLLASMLGLNLGLASREMVDARAEWKASFFMAIAFFPQCLGMLALLGTASGTWAIISGVDHWWGRLLWAPALSLPIFGAAWMAALLVALSDEFLARGHGLEPPAYEPFRIEELIRPWR